MCYLADLAITRNIHIHSRQNCWSQEMVTYPLLVTMITSPFLIDIFPGSL